ncbi:MAG: RNA 3'-terminal phosphate cyclase [Candidatus Hodarchaeota archaeon]
MQVYDGSRGEGGGAILRLVTSLALVKQEPVKVINIRKKRSNPGLRTQHLIGLRTLANLCGGVLEGDSLGSDTIIFRPAKNWTSNLKVNISTAGSIGLVLQSLQVGILGAKNHFFNVSFEGGATFGKWAPTLVYIDNITWDIFRQMNFELNLSILRHGFFPKGGAQVTAEIHTPTRLIGLKLESFEQPSDANIISIASKHLQKARVAERQSKTIQKKLNGNNFRSIIKNEYVDADNPGSGVLIYSKLKNGNRIGGDFIGERKLPAEKVGLNAFDRYNTTIMNQCTVDSFLADQILPILALASSSSVFTTPFISNHTQTNINLLQDMLDVEITVEKLERGFKIAIDV